MWREAPILLALLLAGCMTPMQVSTALEAPLPPEGTPFLVLASSCDAGHVGAYVLYSDGALFHVALDTTAGATAGAPGTDLTRAEIDEAVYDAASTGALDARPFTDAQGRLRLTHAEKTTLETSDFDDLRRRVTLAGFPALDDSYGTTGCADHYAAWADGAHWHTVDRGASAPWVLRHVGDGLRELHGAP